MSDITTARVDGVNLPFRSAGEVLTYYNSRYVTIITDSATGGIVYAYTSADGTTWVNDDQVDAPTTRSVFASYIDGQNIIVAVDNPSTFEVRLYKFDMGTRSWSLLSASGITATSSGGSNLLLQKDASGTNYVVVYYSTATTARYVRYNIGGSSWGSPVTITGITPYLFLIDTANIYHFVFEVTSFVAPVQLHHQSYSSDLAQTDQTIWTGPATLTPANVKFAFPFRQWNSRIAFAFQYYINASDTTHAPAIAYANTGEANPSWTVSPSGGTHTPSTNEFALVTLGTGLAPVWIQTGGGVSGGVNDVYYRALSSGFAWDASDTKFYDYETNPPDPNSPTILSSRLANGITTFEDAAQNDHGFVAIVNFTVNPPTNTDLTAYFMGGGGGVIIAEEITVAGAFGISVYAAIDPCVATGESGGDTGAIADGEPPSLLPCREMPLVMYRERTGKWDFAIELNGATLGITAYNIRFTAKWDKYDDDADRVFTATVGSGITKTNPTAGEIQVEIEPSQTTSLPRHDVNLYYDLQIQDPTTSEVYTVRSGTLIVYATVSLTVP